MKIKWLLVLLGAVALLRCSWASVENDEELAELEAAEEEIADEEEETLLERDRRETTAEEEIEDEEEAEEEEEDVPLSRVRRQSGCKDLLDYCGQWPPKYCNDYKDYMKNNCPRMCGYCTGPTQPPVCEDKEDNYCPGWKDYGYCKKSSQYHYYMKANCAKTCGFCGGGGGGGGGGSCSSSGSSNKVKACNFDKNLCDWYNVKFDGQGDFELKTGSEANGGSGGYLQASAGVAKLRLPLELVLAAHNTDHGTMCLRFHYKGNGGNLNVYEIANRKGYAKKVVKTINVTGGSWSCAKVSVKVSVHNQLQIETKSTSPMYLDDISFADKC